MCCSDSTSRTPFVTVNKYFFLKKIPIRKGTDLEVEHLLLPRQGLALFVPSSSAQHNLVACAHHGQLLRAGFGYQLKMLCSSFAVLFVVNNLDSFREDAMY